MHSLQTLSEHVKRSNLLKRDALKNYIKGIRALMDKIYKEYAEYLGIDNNLTLPKALKSNSLEIFETERCQEWLSEKLEEWDENAYFTCPISGDKFGRLVCHEGTDFKVVQLFESGKVTHKTVADFLRQYKTVEAYLPRNFNTAKFLDPEKGTKKGFWTELKEVYEDAEKATRLLKKLSIIKTVFLQNPENGDIEVCESYKISKPPVWAYKQVVTHKVTGVTKDLNLKDYFFAIQTEPNQAPEYFSSCPEKFEQKKSEYKSFGEGLKVFAPVFDKKGKLTLSWEHDSEATFYKVWIGDEEALKEIQYFERTAHCYVMPYEGKEITDSPKTINISDETEHPAFWVAQKYLSNLAESRNGRIEELLEKGYEEIKGV